MEVTNSAFCRFMTGSSLPDIGLPLFGHDGLGQGQGLRVRSGVDDLLMQRQVQRGLQHLVGMLHGDEDNVSS